jgi:predicted dehydrogenase
MTTRRKFLKYAGITAAGFTIVPRHVLGKGYISPSDKLNIAAIGAGGKAEVNIPLAFNNGADNIAVLCDVDDRMSATMRKKFPTAKYYKDYREMLDKEKNSIDAVIVTTPDHMHYVQTIAAMELGKHVYTEKPLTHDIAEARWLTEAEQKYKVVTQMGNQGASGDATRKIETWVQKGVLGDVHTVHVWTNRPVWPQGVQRPKNVDPVPAELSWDLWLGTAPHREFNNGYLPAIWRGWWDFGTGALGDMGCHFIDVPFRALQLGYPTSVECSVAGVWSGFFQEADYSDSGPTASKIHIQFPARGNMKAVELIWYDGGIKPKRPAELMPDQAMGEVDGGIIFEGTKGKLMAGLFGRNPTLLPTNKMNEASLPKADKAFVPGGWDGHQAQWTAACKKGWGAYTSSPFSMAGPLVETVLMGNLATRSYNLRKATTNGGYTNPGQKQLLWDGKNMRITNFDEANAFVKRQYRKF